MFDCETKPVTLLASGDQITINAKDFDPALHGEPVKVKPVKEKSDKPLTGLADDAVEDDAPATGKRAKLR